MKFKVIITKIQSIFNVSKFELTAISILILGAIIATPAKYFIASDQADNLLSAKAYLILDSIAHNQQTSYIGSDVSGEPDPTLTAGDTIIQIESKFPISNKKKIIDGVQISLNSASKAELMKIPNVGDATANKIIEYRSKTKFRHISEITNIKGIGIKKFEKMKTTLKL